MASMSEISSKTLAPLFVTTRMRQPCRLTTFCKGFQKVVRMASKCILCKTNVCIFSATAFALQHRADFRCDRCGKSYKFATSFAKHAKYECGRSPKFRCSICPFRSHQIGSYRRHMLTHNDIPTH